MPNLTSPAPPSTGCGIEATIVPSLGNSPSAIRMPREGDDPAAAHAGDAHEADVLRERSVRKRIEHAADDCSQAVGSEPARDLGGADLLSADLAQCEKHAGRFDHDHDHHDA